MNPTVSSFTRVTYVRWTLLGIVMMVAMQLMAGCPAGSPALDPNVVSAPQGTGGQTDGSDPKDADSKDADSKPTDPNDTEVTSDPDADPGEPSDDPDDSTGFVGIPVQSFVRFSVDPAEGRRPLTVDLQAYTVDGTPLPDGEYTWSVGDQLESGPPETHANMQHTFTNAGRHAVRLTITVAGLRSQSNARVRIKMVLRLTQRRYALIARCAA